jgi:predicted MPP superfamily phosphohydrolase
MRSWRYVWAVPILVLALDLYVFQAVKAASQAASPRVRSIVYSVYWAVSILALVVLCFMPFLLHRFEWLEPLSFFVLVGFYFAKVLVCFFLVLDDIRRVIQWIAGRLLASRFLASRGVPRVSSEGISRSVFMSWLGLGVGTGIYAALCYGLSNKYRYRVRRVKLAFEKLPPSFKGLKIVQISDIHTGSLKNPDAVRRGAEMVLAEKADLILFTGDLVNDIALEVGEYQGIFSCLTAPMGVYSTLGNHDYGDYSWWENAESKKANLDHLKRIHEEMGWRLLMNEHVVLERNGEKIALLGIENWSAKSRFPKYGKLDEAYAGAQQYPFKILMSHDPSHWDAEVRKDYPDIDLTLSGHTHGMQFGLEVPGFKWSPVQYIYKEWAGLYEEGVQKLYVNRGFGFIGYPGRVGIMPEITVIELA